MIALSLLFFSALVAPARAGSGFGVGVDVARDLPESAFPEARASFGNGPGLRVPIRVGLRDGVALRLTPALGITSGTDTVVWSEYNGNIRYYSDDHAAALFTGSVMVGPELILGQASGVFLQPYGGAEVGYALIRERYTFDGAAEEALVSPGGENPTLKQGAPMAGAHAGLRLAFTPGFALEVEAGYNVSFLNETALEQTPEQLEAVRAAFGLNMARVGAAVAFTFGAGKDG